MSTLNNKKEGNSFGNGSAMRISPVGFLFDTLEEVKEESKKATIPSHNHEDSIKASEAVAVSIFLLRKGMSNEEVIKYIKDNNIPEEALKSLVINSPLYGQMSLIDAINSNLKGYWDANEMKDLID